VRHGLLTGPSIIVADEAHQMKNEKSHYCRSMRQLESRRRLALTGYPLQNNMNEYYQMILWVSGWAGVQPCSASGAVWAAGAVGGQGCHVQQPSRRWCASNAAFFCSSQ
jgi:hypothetical protein